jgi:hypothetical protein
MALTSSAYCAIPSAVLKFVLDREDLGHQPTLPLASPTVKLRAIDQIMFTNTVKILVAAASILYLMQDAAHELAE